MPRIATDGFLALVAASTRDDDAGKNEDAAFAVAAADVADLSEGGTEVSEGAAAAGGAEAGAGAAAATVG